MLSIMFFISNLVKVVIDLSLLFLWTCNFAYVLLGLFLIFGICTQTISNNIPNAFLFIEITDEFPLMYSFLILSLLTPHIQLSMCISTTFTLSFSFFAAQHSSLTNRVDLLCLHPNHLKRHSWAFVYLLKLLMNLLICSHS